MPLSPPPPLRPSLLFRRPAVFAQRRRVGLLLGLLGLCAQCGKDPEVRAVALSKEADAAFSQQKWELGEKKAQEIVALSGLVALSRDQAKLKIEQARSEQQARGHFQRFMGSRDTDLDAAIAAYRELPDSSYYRQAGRPDYDKLRPSFVADHLEKAEAALQNGRCSDLKAQLQLLLDVEPQNPKVLELGKKPCNKKD